MALSAHPPLHTLHSATRSGTHCGPEVVSSLKSRSKRVRWLNPLRARTRVRSGFNPQASLDSLGPLGPGLQALLDPRG
eukprot:791531-Pyramimonas_sp.AAC.1